MINYTAANQLTFENFQTSFEQQLDKKNRRVVLADIIPWDNLANNYSKKLSGNSGRLTINKQ